MIRIDLFDGGYLYYDRGNFDDWCIYEKKSHGGVSAPRDIDYFYELYRYRDSIGNDIYRDFVWIYDMTSNEFNEHVVDVIREISKKYKEYEKDIFRIFAILYMGMIAEENKKNTKLGKRIKRLGVHYLLIDFKSPLESAKSFNNIEWNKIDKLCRERGF